MPNVSFYYRFISSAGLTDYLNRFHIVHHIFSETLGGTLVHSESDPQLGHMNNDKQLMKQVAKYLGLFKGSTPIRKINFEEERILIPNQFPSVSKMAEYISTFKPNTLFYVDLIYESKYDRLVKLDKIKNLPFYDYNLNNVKILRKKSTSGFQSKKAVEYQRQFEKSIPEKLNHTRQVLHIRRGDTGYLDLKGFESELLPEYQKNQYFDILQNKLVCNFEEILNRPIKRKFTPISKIAENYKNILNAHDLIEDNTIVFSDLLNEANGKKLLRFLKGTGQEKTKIISEIFKSNQIELEREIKNYFHKEQLVLGVNPFNTMLLIHKYLNSDIVILTKTGNFDQIFYHYPRKTRVYKI